MKNNPNKQSDFSRRVFIAKGALLGAGMLSGCSSLQKDCGGPGKPFQVVQGWAQAGHPQVKSRGIDADAKGRLYIAGDAEHPIIMMSPEGKYLGDWGKDVLVTPHGVRVQGDTVWVTDLDLQMALQFTLKGKLIRSFGEKGKAGDAPNQFNRPTDFAFGPDGAVYISDGYKNTRVVCYAPDGTIGKIWGEKGTGPGQFDLVHAIAIDKTGRVYVADRNNNRIQIFDLDGNYQTEWTHLGRPYGFYICGKGMIFICGLVPENGKFRVLRVNPDGKVLDEFGETGAGPGQFKMAHSIHVAKAGGVYVADGAGNYVQKFTRG